MTRDDFDYTDAADTKRQLDDMTVQAAFWKQCAENAITGWLQQEDVSVALRELLVQACEAGLTVIAYVQPYASFQNTQALLERYRLEATADDAPEDV